VLAHRLAKREENGNHCVNYGVVIHCDCPIKGHAPTADYVPMADPVATEPKAKVYDESSDADSVRAAAADLDKARAENRIPRAEDEPIDRGYRYYAGEKAGEPVEPEQTLTPERASRDLRMVREYEAASQQPAPEVVASAVDQIRAANNGEPQPQQPSELNDQARAHMAAEQAQQDDVHPDVRAALQNEHVREALAKEVASVEQARAQYAASARGAAQLAAASLLASFPELAQVPTNQLQGAISVIAQKDPARAQAIGAALERTKALYDASQQAQAAQQKIQAENLKAWTVAQEQKFEREVLARESPESLAKIKAILPESHSGVRNFEGRVCPRTGDAADNALGSISGDANRCRQVSLGTERSRQQG
jgi:hypothetical protein